MVSVPTGETHLVRVAVYDVQGRLVRALVDRSLAGGTHTVRWDQRNTRGQKVSSGIYFIQMKAREVGFLDTKKVVVLR